MEYFHILPKEILDMTLDWAFNQRTVYEVICYYNKVKFRRIGIYLTLEQAVKVWLEHYQIAQGVEPHKYIASEKKWIYNLTDEREERFQTEKRFGGRCYIKELILNIEIQATPVYCFYNEELIKYWYYSLNPSDRNVPFLDFYKVGECRLGGDPHIYSPLHCRCEPILDFDELSGVQRIGRNEQGNFSIWKDFKFKPTEELEAWDWDVFDQNTHLGGPNTTFSYWTLASDSDDSGSDEEWSWARIN